MTAIALLLATGLIGQDKPNVFWLDDLDLSQIEQGWGRPQKGKTVIGEPLLLGGRTHTRGIGTHAFSSCAIALKGNATNFSAVVGVVENANTKTSIQYQVIVDGVLRFTSGTLRMGSKPLSINLNISKASTMLLKVLDAGDDIFADHAVWADARVTLLDPNILPSAMTTLGTTYKIEQAKLSGDKEKIASAGLEFGWDLWNQGRYKPSKEAFLQALRVAQAANQPSLKARILHGLSRAKIKCGDSIAESIGVLDQARTIAAQLPFESDLINMLLLSSYMSTRLDQQLAFVAAAVNYVEKHPDKFGARMETRREYIRLLAANRQIDKARALVLKWLNQAPKGAAPRLFWVINLAIAAEFARLPEVADKLHREGLALARDPNLNWDPRVVAMRFASPLFEGQQRIEILKEAERIILASGDIRDAFTKEKLGYVYSDLYMAYQEHERYREAEELVARLRSDTSQEWLRYLISGYLVCNEIGALIDHAWSTVRMGTSGSILLALQGLSEAGAGDRLVLASTISERVPGGSWEWQAMASRLLAQAYAERGEKERALAEIKKANDTGVRAYGGIDSRTLLYSGKVYRQVGRTKDAVNDLYRAYETARVTDDSFYLGEIARNYALALIEVGQPEGALEVVREMLSYRRQAKRSSVYIPMLYCRGLAQELMGATSLARASYGEAIKGLEQRRLSLAGMTSTQMTDFSETRWVYQRSMLLDVQAGNIEQALQTLQAAKARSLQDVVSQSSYANSSAADSAERDALARELRSLTEALNDASAGNDAARLGVVQRQVAAKELQVREFDERAAFKQGLPTVKPVVDLAYLADRLGEDGLILDLAYVDANLGRARKRAVVIFGIDRHEGKARLRAFQVARPEDVAVLAANLESSVSSRSPRWQTDAEAMGKILPPPQWFVGKRRIILCGDGPLSTTPLHVLPDPEDPSVPLGLKREVSYVYAATTIGLGKISPGDLPIFALSDPNFGNGAEDSVTRSLRDDLAGPLARGGVKIRGGFAALPGTRLEAEAIKGVFPNGVYVSGNNATQAAIKQDGVRARYVHMATHGIANSDSPLLSCLVLAPDRSDGVRDRFLTAGEVLTMSWKAEMVVLSACDTANGARMSGEGVVGLGWAFFAKGVRTQVLSQWKVDDQATAFLMKSFYNGLSQGASKPEALKGAMEAVSRDSKWGHPYYWAPFVCLGEAS